MGGLSRVKRTAATTMIAFHVIGRPRPRPLRPDDRNGSIVLPSRDLATTHGRGKIAQASQLCINEVVPTAWPVDEAIIPRTPDSVELGSQRKGRCQQIFGSDPRDVQTAVNLGASKGQASSVDTGHVRYTAQ